MAPPRTRAHRAFHSGTTRYWVTQARTAIAPQPTSFDRALKLRLPHDARMWPSPAPARPPALLPSHEHPTTILRLLPGMPPRRPAARAPRSTPVGVIPGLAPRRGCMNDRATNRFRAAAPSTLAAGRRAFGRCHPALIRRRSPALELAGASGARPANRSDCPPVRGGIATHDTRSARSSFGVGSGRVGVGSGLRLDRHRGTMTGREQHDERSRHPGCRRHEHAEVTECSVS